MLAYRLGRALQFLAMVDCGVALLIGLSAPQAYGIQLLVLGSAALLFGAGRLLQRRGEASLPEASPREAGLQEAPRGPAGP
ncbi:MAG: hypothetical protein HYZ11_12590 [Candidatus Tectomicrobia bacterium]|uniref:Uncharacterized protein n=1 Tax=Tectimicrobiota bacterium TaxID=2528274 RepID=A0A932I328_UNCTE|nr:hypothetical protein [Candidatus Tectomicrobia bacterium]